MSSLLLTRADLETLTGGKTRARIKRWLLLNGWAHTLDLNGWPAVSRAYFEAKMAGGVALPPRAANGPRFDLLKQGRP